MIVLIQEFNADYDLLPKFESFIEFATARYNNHKWNSGLCVCCCCYFFLYTPLSNTTVFFSTKFIVMWHARNYFVCHCYSVIFPFNLSLSLILLFWCEWQRIPFMLAVWFVLSSEKHWFGGRFISLVLAHRFFFTYVYKQNVDTTVI